MGLLRTILILALVYYGFRFLARYVFPFFLKRYVNKKTQEFQNQFDRQNRKDKKYVKEHEGEVKIKSSKKNKSQKESDDIGDYVDYEEVE